MGDELTYEQAADRLAQRGTAQRPVRPQRTVEIAYRENVDGSWTATSPQLRRLREQGQSLSDAERLVDDRLNGWIDPEVLIRASVYRLPETTATALPGLLSISGHASGLLKVTVGGTQRQKPCLGFGRISRRTSA
ncbi:hypothetical protein [Nonomuraea cavernae]|uniref:hypothetical protein n=1 Tax=Nonomuraea cavernae TaxID=2045107 RepID=UPI0033E24F65